VLVDLRQVERMTGPLSQLLEVEQLGAPVALAKWVDVVDVCNDLAGLAREFSGVQSAQEIQPDQSSVNVGHAGFDEAAKLELMAVLGNLYRPQFADPIIDVPEKVSVHGPQMSKVEIASRRTFGDALQDELGLEGSVSRASPG
jgi:hypothetical protein